MSIPPEIQDVISIVKKQDSWRRATINLIASENVVSPLARSVLDSDFNHRYAEGDIGKRGYQGAKYIDELETVVIDLAKRLFDVKHVEHRAISGALSNLAVYYALVKPGQKIFTLTVPEGAHISFRQFGVAGTRGLQVFDIPFDQTKMNIDLDAFVVKLHEEKPDIVTLGGSLFLFPHPVHSIKKACQEVGSRLHYDGAHVFGLISGKQFQDPLGEGADVLTGSTHKTLPGPQGALILTNDEKIYSKVNRAIFPGLVSNHHLGRMAPLAITLAEMIQFGRAYALQIVKNAQHLARVLDDLGFDVLAKDQGYTRSHQVAVRVAELGGGDLVAKKLERVNIIANKNLIPGDDVNQSDNPSGLRLGVQELTRYGMAEPEMERVAHLIQASLRQDVDEEQIKQQVAGLLGEFSRVEYCFKQ